MMIFLIYAWKAPIKQVVGNDLVIAIQILLASSISHLFIAEIDYNLLITLIIGGIVGVYIGKLLHNKINTEKLKPILVVILMIIGVTIIINALTLLHSYLYRQHYQKMRKFN